MNFIKIGNRYINLDNVTNIGPVNKEFAGEAGIYQIEYIGKNSEDYGSEWVEGHEAQALVDWLNAIATDVVAVFESDIMTSNPDYAPTPEHSF